MVAVIEMNWQDILDGQPVPESPARQLFTNTVIAVAAQAKAALPQANGRVDRARDLVLGGLVSRNADGTFTVRSQSERGKSYIVSEGVCSCPHAQNGEPTCKHLISTWLWRKARKAIEAQLASDATEQQPAPAQPQGQPVSTPVLPEAPASANAYVLINGHRVQVTLRDTNEDLLLERIAKILERFPTEGKHEEPKEGWCSKHHTQMKQRNGKHGKAFWSHQVDGQWCHGK